MADVGGNNRAGREEKQINTSAEESGQERGQLVEEDPPAPLSPVVRTEDRDVLCRAPPSAQERPELAFPSVWRD